jgi:hypothetical protein
MTTTAKIEIPVEEGAPDALSDWRRWAGIVMLIDVGRGEFYADDPVRSCNAPDACPVLRNVEGLSRNCAIRV